MRLLLSKISLEKFLPNIFLILLDRSVRIRTPYFSFIFRSKRHVYIFISTLQFAQFICLCLTTFVDKGVEQWLMSLPINCLIWSSSAYSRESFFFENLLHFSQNFQLSNSTCICWHLISSVFTIFSCIAIICQTILSFCSYFQKKSSKPISIRIFNHNRRSACDFSLEFSDQPFVWLNPVSFLLLLSYSLLPEK